MGAFSPDIFIVFHIISDLLNKNRIL